MADLGDQGLVSGLLLRDLSSHLLYNVLLVNL